MTKIFKTQLAFIQIFLAELPVHKCGCNASSKLTTVDQFFFKLSKLIKILISVLFFFSNGFFGLVALIFFFRASFLLASFFF